MRFLRTLHLYLGCLFAPMLIFFAVTGSWQVFNWHRSDKNWSGYHAPEIVSILSEVHKEAHITGRDRSSPAPVRYFMVAAAGGLVLTAVLGVIMAYRFSRRPVVATISLMVGIILPVALLWIYK